MPIEISKLKEAKRPLEQRILEFLERERETAFTLQDIIVAMEQINRQDLLIDLMLQDELGEHPQVRRYRETLAALVAKGKIVEQEHGGNKYYALAGEL